MKITYTKPINTVPFKDIAVGGCFIDHEGEICMKLFKNTCEYVAICFSDGRVYPDDAFLCNVQPVEVELIVHAEEP